MLRILVISMGFVIFIGAACGIETNQSPAWFYEAYFWGSLGIAIMYAGKKLFKEESVVEIEHIAMPVESRTRSTICRYPVINPYTRRIHRN